MNRRVEIDLRGLLDDSCPWCGGTGKQKAMQRLALLGGGSVRGPNTWVVCVACHGTGRRTKNENHKARS